MVRKLATSLAAALLPASAAHADALQNQILTAARATRPDMHAFRRTLTFERSGAPRKVFVEQFDPRRPAADRWLLISVDARAPTPKEIADSRKVKRGPTPSYAELAKWIGTPATRADTVPGHVTYRFARLPAGTLKFGAHDASADTQAEALVDTRGATPFVERVRFTSTKGFTMMLVASLKSMTVDARYRLLPGGQPVPSETASLITGAMLGKPGELRSNATFSDFTAVR